MASSYAEYDCESVPEHALVYIKKNDQFVQGRVVKVNEVTLCVTVLRYDGMRITDVYPFNNPDFIWKGEYDYPPHKHIVPLMDLEAQAEAQEADPNVTILLPNAVASYPDNSSKTSSTTTSSYTPATYSFVQIVKSGNCEICSAETSFRCNECMRAFYCSRKCQKTGWTAHASKCSTLKSGYVYKSASSTSSAVSVVNGNPITVVDCSYSRVDTHNYEMTPGSVRVGGSKVNRYANDDNFHGRSKSARLDEDIRNMGLNVIPEEGCAQLTAENISKCSRASSNFNKNRNNVHDSYSSGDECSESENISPETSNYCRESQPKGSQPYGPIPPPPPLRPTVSYATAASGCSAVGPLTVVTTSASAEPADLENMITQLSEILGYSKSNDEIKSELRRANWDMDRAMGYLFNDS